MFWRYNNFVSHIETLLEKQDVTIKELMDEDDIIQECKGQNPKLLEFLVTPEVMDQLVAFVTKEPEDITDAKNIYKYPNIACELLTSDITQIVDRLIEDNVLIDKVYKFLSSSQHLNPLLASFFTKIMLLLLNRKTEYLTAYLRSKENEDGFLKLILPHLGTCAIMDLLTKIIQYDPMYEKKEDILTWLDDESLIERLIDSIHPDYDEEVHSNASFTLCEIIKFQRDQLSSEFYQYDPLMNKLESEEMIARLLDNMLINDNGIKESVCTNGLMVVQCLLEYRRSLDVMDDWRTLPEGEPVGISQHEQDRLDKAINIVITCIIPKIEQISAILTHPPQMEGMLTTVGILNPPLGQTRLSIAKLLSSLYTVNCNTETLYPQLIQHNVLNVLLDLFFKYEWNNFLHADTANCIEIILTPTLPPSTRDTSQPLELKTEQDDEPTTPTPTEINTTIVSHLYKECHILERMLEAWKINEERITTAGRRPGYMGHITKICNALVQAEGGPASSPISELVSALTEETQTCWKTLVTTQLADTNQRNTKDLVGGHPLLSNDAVSSDDDSDFRDINFPQDASIQQAFSDYQMQQLTSTFVEQLGLSADEFTNPNSRTDAAFNQNVVNWSTNTDEVSRKNFERECDMKISAFDDDDTGSDDDADDPWANKGITLNTTGSGKAAIASIPSSNLSNSSDEDSSSDEELPSPAVIKPKQEPVAMDIDNPTEENSTTPVAMDTASPWDTVPENTSGEADGWASFGGEQTPNSSANEPETEDAWADFSSIDSIEGGNSGPRSSSPEPLTDKSSPAIYTDTKSGDDSTGGDSINEELEQFPIEQINTDTVNTVTKEILTKPVENISLSVNMEVDDSQSAVASTPADKYKINQTETSTSENKLTHTVVENTQSESSTLTQTTDSKIENKKDNLRGAQSGDGAPPDKIVEEMQPITPNGQIVQEATLTNGPTEGDPAT